MPYAKWKRKSFDIWFILICVINIPSFFPFLSAVVIVKFEMRKQFARMFCWCDRTCCALPSAYSWLYAGVFTFSQCCVRIKLIWWLNTVRKYIIPYFYLKKNFVYCLCKFVFPATLVKLATVKCMPIRLCVCHASHLNQKRDEKTIWKKAKLKIECVQSTHYTVFVALSLCFCVLFVANIFIWSVVCTVLCFVPKLQVQHISFLNGIFVAFFPVTFEAAKIELYAVPSQCWNSKKSIK